jgi:molybdopterin synthase catalytic subunit
MNDWIELSENPLLIDKAIAFVTDPAAGGIAVFLGTTRAEKSSSGRTLLALDYQAYEAMALEQFGAFAAEARGRWPVSRLAILHRTGRVEVGQCSVLIAVCTPHRAAAFEACEWIMDRIKSQAAIWKKEVWSDGEAAWVHPD